MTYSDEGWEIPDLEYLTIPGAVKMRLPQENINCDRN